MGFLSKPCVFSSAGDERSRESPAPAEAQMQAGAEGSGRVNRCCWKCSVTQLKKIFWGVAVVLGVCSSWSGSTQLAKLTFKKFDAPFTLTWFATNWNFLFFPLYYLGHVFKSAEKQSPKQRYRYGRFFFFSHGSCMLLYISETFRSNQSVTSNLCLFSSPGLLKDGLSSLCVLC